MSSPTDQARRRSWRAWWPLSLLASFAVVVGGLVPSPPAQASAQTVLANAEAHVYSSYPSLNYGDWAFVRVDDDPIRNGYLRFDLSGVGSPITKATLQVLAKDSHPTGFAVHPVPDSSWVESSITYANAPAIDPPVVPASGKQSGGEWVSIDVTPAVKGTALVSLGLTTSSSSSLSILSRESGATK